jgi:alginate O-acetyltransferase complex protein AlgI
VLFNDPWFLFAFLPVTLGLTCAATWLGGRLAGILGLIAASLFFYGWWKASGLFIVLGSIAVNLPLARVLERLPSGALRKGLLAIGIVINLSVLAYFKYANFFIQNVAAIGWSFPALNVVLPIGLSFYTFQQIAFLVDTYRGDIGRVTPLEYVVSVLFFPHLIAGPLVHYRNIIEQFRTHFRVSYQNITLGLPIFMIGLSKKVVIADSIAVYVSPIYANALKAPVDTAAAWIASLGFTAQLYFDFSGYSDMAIGLGIMFGILLPVNFRSPYKATSIIEFWHRWHITLAEFLRDYLYYPLGGNRKGTSRRYANLMIVMLLGGLWHGAAWTFIFWGALHGGYLMINHGWRNIASPRVGIVDRLLTPFYALLTFLCVLIAWVFFKSPNFATALTILRAMGGENGFILPHGLFLAINEHITAMPTTLYPGVFSLDSRGVPFPDIVVAPILIIAALVLAWCTPNTAQLFRIDADPRTKSWHATPLRMACAGVLGFLCLFSLFASTPSEFLYFQF